MQIMQTFTSFPCVLSTLGFSHYLLKCIHLTVYHILLFLCIYGCIFHQLDVVPDTKFKDYIDRKLSLQKLPRITNNCKVRKSCNAVLNTGTLTMKNAAKCSCSSH